MEDIWGRPYRAVMKFVRTRTVSNPLKGHVVTGILDTLFPVGQTFLEEDIAGMREYISLAQNWGELDLSIPPVTEEEVKTAFP